jgi:transcriptional regulator with XRE-family HTH domain
MRIKAITSLCPMTPEQTQEIIRLRALNLSPKQIARKLGLRPAEVSAWLKNQAEEVSLSRRERGELAPWEQCLINEIAARQLLEPKKKGWFSRKKEGVLSDKGAEGLAEILVTRVEGNQYLVAMYLVDYWCLGVKDASRPLKLNRQKYEALIKKIYAPFQSGTREITLEEAQSIIFGSVDYAAQLGLKPHRDFEAAKAHLGKPPEKLLPIEFGREGKPCYVSGPYDNPERILAKLRETVGEGNFDCVILG